MPSLLFVCTANLYRSPLAAAFFEKKLQAEGDLPGCAVESAGTWTTPGQRLPAEALAAASAFGLDLKRHRTRQVSQELLTAFDLILVMERGHRESLCIEFPALQVKVHLLSQMIDRLDYDIPDPARAGVSLEEMIEEMAKDIDQAYPRICRLVRALESFPFPLRGNVNFTL